MTSYNVTVGVFPESLFGHPDGIQRHRRQAVAAPTPTTVDSLPSGPHIEPNTRAQCRLRALRNRRPHSMQRSEHSDGALASGISPLAVQIRYEKTMSAQEVASCKQRETRSDF